MEIALVPGQVRRVQMRHWEVVVQGDQGVVAPKFGDVRDS